MSYRKSEQRRIDDLEQHPPGADDELCLDCRVAVGLTYEVGINFSDDPVEVTEHLCPRCNKVYTDPVVIKWVD